WHTEATGQKHWVFGTELPRAVLNEAYAEVANHPAQPSRYTVSFWVELHNPFFRDASLSDGGAARLQMPPSGADPAYAVYQLIVAATPNVGLFDPGNALGDPDEGKSLLVLSRYDPDPAGPPPVVDTNLIQPANGQYSGPVAGNAGFYVLGPRQEFP